MAQDFTAKFRVDISDLKKNITEARKEIKLADAAFKAGTAGMDDWKTDAEGLSKKLEQLKSVLQNQKTILDAYRQQLERQQHAYEENGSRADQLRAKLQELASRGVDKASDEYKQYETALKNCLKEQDSNAKSADDLKIKILNAEAAVGKTEKEMRQYSTQLDHAGDETKELTRETKEADTATEKLSGGFSVMRGVLVNLITDGLRKAADELKDLVTGGAEYADEIITMSKQTGVATDKLQEFKYMSKLVDVDVETFAGSLKKLTKNMGSAQKGTGAAYDAFSDLGVSVTDANGELRDSEDVFADVIDALGGIQNETERDVKSMAIFGKSATDLNPLIVAGSDAIKGWTQEAHDMGYVMDDEMLGSLGDLQDSFDRFDLKMEAIKNRIGAQLAPALDTGIEKLSELADSVDWEAFGEKAGQALSTIIDILKWILEHGDVVAGVLGAIVAALAVSKIADAAKGFSALKDSISGTIGVAKNLGSVLVANPWVALATAIVAAGVALIKWQSDLFAAERAADATWQKTDRLTESLETAADAAGQAASEYQVVTDAMEDSVGAAEAEMAQVQGLADELKNLAGKNGEVAETDRARAQFLLTQLNKALGTEYTMTGNVIDQYDDLKGSIDAVIQKKKAMLVLKAEEEAYTQAITKGADAEQRLRELQQQRLPVQVQLAENEDRMNYILSQSGDYMKEHASELGKLSEQNKQLSATLEETNDEFEAVSRTVDQSSYDIQQYTRNATAAIEEDYDSIAHKSYDTAVAAGEAASEASSKVIAEASGMTTGWMEQMGTMLSETTGMDVEFKDAGYGMVQAYADGQKIGKELPATQMADMTKQMMWHARTLNQELEASAGNIGTGVANGIYNSSGTAFNAMQWMAQGLLSKFNQEMKIKSPSRKMEESAGYTVAGFIKGVQKNTAKAQASMQTLAKKVTTTFDDTLGQATEEIRKKNESSVDSFTKKSQKIIEDYNKAVKSAVSDNKKLAQDVTKLAVKLKEDLGSVNMKLAEYVRKAKENLKKDLADVNSTLKKDLAKVKDTLASDIASLRTEYANTVKSRYSSTMGQLGIGEVIETKDAVPVKTLTKNLKDQVKVLKEYSENLELIRQKFTNKELIDELEGLGLDNTYVLMSFAAMTDKEIKEYEKLYAAKQKLAKKDAKGAYEDEKYLMNTRIEGLKAEAAAQAEELKAAAAAQAAALKEQTAKDIEVLKADSEKKVAELTKQYKKDLKKLGITITKETTDIGKAIADGISSGFKAAMAKVNKSTSKDLDDLLKSMKKKLKIASPSGMTKPFGQFLAQGLGVGFTDEMKAVNRDIQRALPKEAMFGAMAGISGGAVVGRVTETQVTNNFTQNNYSPKPLNRFDIYRDTHNALALAALAKG